MGRWQVQVTGNVRRTAVVHCHDNSPPTIITVHIANLYPWLPERTQVKRLLLWLILLSTLYSSSDIWLTWCEWTGYSLSNIWLTRCEWTGYSWSNIWLTWCEWTGYSLSIIWLTWCEWTIHLINYLTVGVSGGYIWSIIWLENYVIS